MNRREFVRRLESLSAAGAAAGLGLPLGGCLGFHYVNSTVSGGRLLVRRADFGESRFVLVDAPGLPLPLFVFRHDDESCSAVSTRCMHRGCQVEPGDGKLVCPCHGSEYTVTGAVLKGPTEAPLRRFAVTADGDVIAIDLAGGAEAP